MPGATFESGKNFSSLWLCCCVLVSGTLEEVVMMSSQKNTFQKRKFLFFLLIGLFLSVCLTLLINSISLPSWMRPLVPLFIVALVALLILVEALKEDTPTHRQFRIPTHEHKEDTPTHPGRRAFFNRFVLPASWITLLTILGGFLTIQEANVETARDQLAKAQQAFDAQRNSQLTRLRIGFDPIGNDPGGALDTSTLDNDLSNHLGMPVTSADVGSTYYDTVKALGEGSIEMAWLSPLSYLYAHQKYGAKVILLRLTREGQKTYQSYIITKKNSGIRTLHDLKGRRFAFVEPWSTSGNLIPRYELKNHDLDPDNDVQSFYAKTQEAVIEQVLYGFAAAGAVSSDNYNAKLEELGQKGSDLTILFKSPVNIPEGPIALRKDIQLYDTLRVEDALLIIGESPTTLRTVNITGFAKATDETYQFLLNIVKYLNIDLSTYNG
jgi:phosphonate transport system substrate-binding protein